MLAAGNTKITDLLNVTPSWIPDGAHAMTQVLTQRGKPAPRPHVARFLAHVCLVPHGSACRVTRFGRRMATGDQVAFDRLAMKGQFFREFGIPGAASQPLRETSK